MTQFRLFTQKVQIYTEKNRDMVAGSGTDTDDRKGRMENGR